MAQQSKTYPAVSGRVLLDTCVLELMYEHDGYIMADELPPGYALESELPIDWRALNRLISSFSLSGSPLQFAISPLTFAEFANNTALERISSRLRFLTDLLDSWLIMVDEGNERNPEDGSVRHRFKLNLELQALEARLMLVPDFRKDPFDRLLLLQTRMYGCETLLTLDRKTLLKHRKTLADEGISVEAPETYWAKWQAAHASVIPPA